MFWVVSLGRMCLLRIVYWCLICWCVSLLIIVSVCFGVMLFGLISLWLKVIWFFRLVMWILKNLFMLLEKISRNFSCFCSGMFLFSAWFSMWMLNCSCDSL